MAPPRPIGSAPTLILERSPESPYEPDSVADAPLVGFDAFVPEHRIFGWIRLEAGRLTDILNDHRQLTLVNVQRERLADGRVEWLEELRLDREGLLAVRAGGPRGDPARRQRARLQPLVVQAGPYLVGGYLHAGIGRGPFEELEHRPPMVPLSTGWLEHWIDGHRGRQWAGTVLFNQALADAIEVVAEGDLEFGVASHPLQGNTAGQRGAGRRAPVRPGGV